MAKTETTTLVEYPRAAISRRLVAAVLDEVIYLTASVSVALISFGLGYLVFHLGWIFVDGYRGKSPGKAIMGLTVVDLAMGRPISWNLSARRNFMFILPVFDRLINLVELVALLVDPKGRRFGDKIANTQVVSDEYVRHVDPA